MSKLPPQNSVKKYLHKINEEVPPQN